MIKDKYTEAPPGPRTTLDQGVHFLKRTVGPAHGLHFATRYMGREGLDSAIISVRGRAIGLKLCNYKKKETTQDSSHMHTTAQLILNFQIQHKQAQYALKENVPSG